MVYQVRAISKQKKEDLSGIRCTERDCDDDGSGVCCEGPAVWAGGSVRIDRIGQLSAIPLLLSVLLWLFPGQTPADSPDAIGSIDVWHPGIELPLMGLASSLLIIIVLRYQDQLQARAHRSW